MAPLLPFDFSNWTLPRVLSPATTAREHENRCVHCARFGNRSGSTQLCSRICFRGQSGTERVFPDCNDQGVIKGQLYSVLPTARPGRSSNGLPGTPHATTAGTPGPSQTRDESVVGLTTVGRLLERT